ncbi:MAG: cysteine desulfurase family protein [Chlamydiota bacterium]
MPNPIYLDNNATTPLDDEVLDIMKQALLLPFNPSSVHGYGRDAKLLLNEARSSIAKHLDVESDSLIFTSGGTESMNMLIKGLYPNKGLILTSSIEHPCIHETLLALGKDKISYVPTNSWGAPALKDIEAHLTQDVSCMVFSAVYSETGVKLDLEGVAHLAHQRNIPLIIDGVALLGKEPFKISQGIHGMGFSSHKLHGPQGVGMVFIAPNAKCKPLMQGGHQEYSLRPGTENLAGILGFAKAVSLAYDHLTTNRVHMLELRNHFESSLKQALKISINGDGPRVCNTSNIMFDDIDGETLLLQLDRALIYASLGSACSSGALEPSRILLNMGLPRKKAKNSIRFSFSRKTLKTDVDAAIFTIIELVKNQIG